MPFRLGEPYTLTVRKPDGSTTRVRRWPIPARERKQRPIVVPDQVVTASQARPRISGYLRVSMFPACWAWTSRAT